MKKLIIYLCAIILLFGGLYAVNMAANGSSDNVYGIREGKLSPMTREQLNDPNYQNIILPKDLKTKLKDGYTGFVYFFSPTCIYCVNTTPVLVPMADEMGIDIPMYNLLEFQEGWSEYGIQSTPTLMYFENGKAVKPALVGGIEITPGDGGWPQEDYRAFLQDPKNFTPSE